MQWHAPLTDGFVNLSAMRHIWHLANFATVTYELYTPFEEWVLIDPYQHIEMSPGEFMILRRADCEDEDCEDLSELIRRFHRDVQASIWNGALAVVPIRYREAACDNEVP